MRVCIDDSCSPFTVATFIVHDEGITNSKVAEVSSEGYIGYNNLVIIIDPNHTFVGVGIEDDAQKLLEDCSLRVANILELRSLAVEKLLDPALKTYGLKTLCLRVLGLQMEKPKKISRSKWDNLWLTPEQVHYAAIDAFVSFEIARRLSSTN
ncbi:hypothetical protein VNO78_16260 [Psophocarpus tetragonolobus]|uniref:3'-5' exonuclease domain-containing protein n=1 Tax=Psophocarpus tetragonolobus TaxID=3891 RepID=A0AAN9SFI6_PSOTE